MMHPRFFIRIPFLPFYPLRRTSEFLESPLEKIVKSYILLPFYPTYEYWEYQSKDNTFTIYSLFA